MIRFMRAALGAVFLCLAFGASVGAQPLACEPVAEVRAELTASGYVRAVTGIDSDGLPFEIWANPARAWILLLAPSPEASALCVVARGADLRTTGPTDPPVAAVPALPERSSPAPPRAPVKQDPPAGTPLPSADGRGPI